MSSWRSVFLDAAVDVENHFDRMKNRLHERLGWRHPLMILPYRGYGTPEKLYLKGRVLEDKGITSPQDNDSVWENLLNMYRRFDSTEIPFAEVRVRFQDREQVVQADEEGFFEAWLEPNHPLSDNQIWHAVDLELVSPQTGDAEPARAEGQVLVPPPGARFGVVSDIDDTVLQTDAVHLLHMARTVFLGNARTRMPFPGVGAFYRALLGSSEMVPGGDASPGPSEGAINPLFYVSSSPWNIYDLLSDFFHIQNIPIGPVLFLRDWGLSKEGFLPTRQYAYKHDCIKAMLDLYKDLPFVLIGDSGQEDPEIYAALVNEYPERILAIYIRNVSRDLKRPDAIRTLAKEVAKAGSTLILADDTFPMAEHAASKGWISEKALPQIKTEVEADKAPPSKVEQLLVGEEKATKEPPAVVVETPSAASTEKAVEEGAIEAAMEEGKEEAKKPPTVVVEGDKGDKGASVPPAKEDQEEEPEDQEPKKK